MGFITHGFGFLFLWFTFACLAVLLWFAFGKYGSVRFGGAEAEPEFRTLSWIAMLFCAGIGTSLLYWATIEWVYYYQAPPFGIEAETAEAAHWAAMYGLFHWGPLAWALYCVPALPIAYAFHNRKIPFLRISQACRGVIGDRADGPLGKLIDVLFIFGLVGGTGTSLGLGTPILSESISTLTGIERTFALDAFVIVIWTAIFGTTVYLGMEKGIKRLADANVYLGFFLSPSFWFSGPTVFILDTFTNSLGLLATNFLKMSFYTDPVGQSGFPRPGRSSTGRGGSPTPRLWGSSWPESLEAGPFARSLRPISSGEASVAGSSSPPSATPRSTTSSTGRCRSSKS